VFLTTLPLIACYSKRTIFVKYPIKLKRISFNAVCKGKRYKINLNSADRLSCSSKIVDPFNSSWEGILRMMERIHTHNNLSLLTLYKDTLTHTKIFFAFPMWVIFHLLAILIGCSNCNFPSLIFKYTCYIYVCMWVGTLMSYWMTELKSASISMDICFGIKSKWSIHFAEGFVWCYPKL
jgi:hypothetical protein